MYISEWLKKGQPKNEWFYIVRHEALDRVIDDTPIRLAKQIILTLDNYGSFIARQCFHPRTNECYHFKFDNIDFIGTITTGYVNMEWIPVLSVGIEAKIV